MSSSSPFSARPGASPKNKTVIVGAGFLASYIAKTLVASSSSNTVLLASRNPAAVHSKLKHLGAQILEPKAGVDISGDERRLAEVVQGASTVVNLVGIMHGSPDKFEAVQWIGAENLARASRKAGAKLVHISAIGADGTSHIDYWRTKGKGEWAVHAQSPDATIIRPSLVFGPGDGFFTRFSKLAAYLPFLPVFGGGKSKFQPVYAGDIARAVEILSRGDLEVEKMAAGKIIEAGGPKVYTYRELMELTLKYSEKSRPILSMPFFVGMIQGFFLEKLPENIFTVTRSQIAQLKKDNIVDPNPDPETHASFAQLLATFPPPEAPSSAPPPKPKTKDEVLTPVEEILPLYLNPKADVMARVKSGKRMHGGRGFEG